VLPRGDFTLHEDQVGYSSVRVATFPLVICETPPGGILRRLVAMTLAISLLVVACGEEDTSVPISSSVVQGKITLVTNNAFSDVDYLLDPFTIQSGVEVEVIAGGSAGSMVNQVILTKDNPLGDVVYGFDNTFLSRLLEEDLFIPYQSPNAAMLPTEFQMDTKNRVTAVDFGDVCINYDKAFFEDAGLAVPADLDDLKKPEYFGLLAVENPATSSPGLAFMLATIAEYGEDDWLAYWEALRGNGVEIAPGWEEAYYTNFSLHGGGQPLVVSYASSPPAEVIFSEPMPNVAPSGVIQSSCFRQIEFIGILRGTENLPAAQALVDWWLTDAMQAELPLNYFVFPVNPNVVLPDSFVEHTVIPSNPYFLDPDLIAKNRDRWIKEWTDVILR